MTVSTFPTDSFLCDVSVYDVNSSDQLIGGIGSPTEKIASRAVESGCAEVSVDSAELIPDASSAIAIPVFRGQQVVSVTVLSSKQLPDDHDNLVGVFEVWEPAGVYEELALKHGFYGRMERFQNVSSFVRFEKGNGLPGQVWQQSSSVIHDDLSNHPGFLRAAGASADLLRSAIGIPVGADRFHSTAVLISSAISPIAVAIEVWQAEEEGFSLMGGAYSSPENVAQYALQPDTRLAPGSGLPGLADTHRGAVLCDDIDRLLEGRTPSSDHPPTSGLAIPYFNGETLTSVATLLF